MGVDDIYKFLKRNKGFYSVKQISEKVDASLRAVRKSMKVISIYDDIVCEFAHQMIAKTKKVTGIKTKRTWVYAHVNSIKTRS